MKIITFDIEEWYIEKSFYGDRKERYQVYDRYLKSVLDLLDERKIKATFFCVGELAKHFPRVVRIIASKGHEIGCHSNTHMWLSNMDCRSMYTDTLNAISALENVCGQKVVSYRAPAFSIGEQNMWAFEVLAECGIERDASIYPAVRDFGGFSSFPTDVPCIIKVNGFSLKEFPICMTKVFGKEFAYSGGGYFRFFPLSFIKSEMKKSDYSMAYFHIGDLEQRKMVLLNKELFEQYYKIPATLNNRIFRMIKSCLGTKGAFNKMINLVNSFDFVNVAEADSIINWSDTKVIDL